MRRIRQSYVSVVLLVTATNLLSLSNNVWWTIGFHSLVVQEEDEGHAAAVVVAETWYHEDEEQARNKVLDPRAFFNTITRIGGKGWTTPRSGEVLDHDEYKLVEIASQVGAAHLVRPTVPIPPHDVLLHLRPKIDIDCSNPIYRRVLTGQKDPNQKIIIDATIFGWDVDLLEIRLLEISDLVHKVVVGEQNANFKGVFKPYFLVPKLLQDRLASFVPQVDFLPQNVSHLIPKIRSNPSKYQWYLESAMRNQTINYIRQQYSHLHSNNNNTRVYVIQNDGDEIPGRTALAHFKECELSKPDSLTIFPSFHYKRNVAYLQKVSNFKDVKLKGKQKRNKIYKYLRSFVWTDGPTIVPWEGIISNNNSAPPFRYGITGRKKKKINMGLGSANHFSNPAHPILGFLKLGSTSDSGLVKMTKEFYQHARDGTITNMEIRNVSYMCHAANDPNHPWMTVSDMEKEVSTKDNSNSNNNTSIEQVLYQHLPWAVQSLGHERYPWLFRQSIVKEEQQVNKCLCFGHCEDVSPNSTIFLGS